MKPFYLALFCAVIVFTSCKKDEPFNPCKDVFCPQNQFCSDGVCVCVDGFVGADCDSQVIPANIQIAMVRLTSFPPLKPGGSEWDIISTSNSADVYFVLYDSQGREFHRVSRQRDQLYNEVTSWNLEGSQIYFPRPFNNCTIKLYDEDVWNAEDDLMGFVDFSPYSLTGNNPSTLYINDGGSISFELDVKYYW